MSRSPMKTLLLSAVAGVALAALPVHPAQATNGYLPHGLGVESKGMAGVGVALSLGATQAATNPAGMLNLGNRLDVGLEFFSPNRRTVATNGGTITNGLYESDENLFFVPDFGVNYMIDKDSSIGFTMVGAGGMNTEYPINPFVNFGAGSPPAGVDLAQMNMGPTYARRFQAAGGTHTIGIMPIFAAQRFKAYGLEAFQGVSRHSAHVTGNGFDYSVGGGGRIGWQGKYFDNWTFGASYKSKLYMTKLTKYKGLFAEEGLFDIPAEANLGVAYKVPNSGVTVALDFQYIFYSDVNSIANTGSGPLSGLTGDTLLGGEKGAGFGWEDQQIVKAGVMWDVNKKLTLRAGASVNTEPYDNNEMLFNILAPATPKAHLSLGGTYRFSDRHAINFAYTRAFNNTIQGTHPSNGPGIVAHTMNQHSGVVAYSYRW